MRLRVYSFYIALLILIFGCNPENSPENIVATIDFKDQSASVTENPDFMESLYTLDFTSNVEVKFAIVSTSHPEAISLSESTGEIKVKTISIFNYEENPTMTFQIKASANEKTVVANLTINLIDIEFEERFAGNVALSSQEQVESFCANNYQTITGRLYIGGLVPTGESPITGISSFNALRVIGDSFTIENTEFLTSMDGLENLEEIHGKFTLNSNQKLISISALSNLTIDTEFRLSNNNLLTNFDGVENINVSNGDISISANRMLTEIKGFETTTELRKLNIRSSDKLTTINGFPNLTTIQDRFVIEICPSLTSLEILPNLSQVNGTFEINDNKALELIHFEAIETIQGLGIENNEVLHTIQFDQLIHMSGGISLINNSDLVNVNGFSAITKLAALYIANNPSFSSLQAFGGLTTVSESLTIENSSLTNLQGLENLTTIEGDLTISNNQFENFTGLEGLTSVHSININNSPILNSFMGLENLETINGLLEIRNTSVVHLNLSNALSTLNGISVKTNPFLESITGVNGELNTMGRINIYNNPVLSSIDLANNTTSMLALRIDQNESLLEINSFNLLESIETGLYIHDNNVLESIMGMKQLNYIGRSFEISENNQLKDFCNFTNLINTNGIQDDYIVNSNAYNPSIGDILAGNCSL